MRELLDALDELAAGPAATRRRQIRTTLTGYSGEVARRIAKLQEQLAGAHTLDASLHQVLHDA